MDGAVAELTSVPSAAEARAVPLPRGRRGRLIAARGDRERARTCPGRWKAEPSWSPAAPAASARRPPLGLASPGAHGSRSPAGTAGRSGGRGRRDPRATADEPWRRSSRTCPRQAEVRQLADGGTPAASPRIDVLVNNVGGFWNTRHVTVDGLEHTFALNHLQLLPAHPPAARPAPSHSGPARIINVALDAHRRVPSLNFDDLEGAQGVTSAHRRYNRSKLANVLFTYELPAACAAPAPHQPRRTRVFGRSGFGAEDPGPHPAGDHALHRAQTPPSRAHSPL